MRATCYTMIFYVHTFTVIRRNSRHYYNKIHLRKYLHKLTFYSHEIIKRFSYEHCTVLLDIFGIFMYVYVFMFMVWWGSQESAECLNIYK